MKQDDKAYCHTTELPAIPDKRYFTIGEVSKLCALRPHVLRYWEQEFTSLAPTKRRGNRRYYRLQDVELVRAIRTLLYEEGYTLQGAKAKLTQSSVSSPVCDFVKKTQKNSPVITSIIEELEQLASYLEQA